jgi:hypothetical protein
MNPIAIQPAEISTRGSDLIGAVVTRELRVGKARFRKGQVIRADDLPALSDTTEPVHAVQIGADEIHENDAGIRLAELVRGEGTMQRQPVQSRVNIVATHKGLVRVNVDALFALNLHPEVGVFTVMDYLPVVAGKIVAGAKISPVAIPATRLEEIERELGALDEPIIRVAPFRPIRAGVVVTEGLSEKIRDRFEKTVCQKMQWYGSDIIRFVYVADDIDEVANAMRALLDDGAQMLFAAGGNMMDPLDPTQQALPHIGARLVRKGAPAHPGSMFWLGHLDEGNVPIVSLASCSMYSRSTVADLVLPRLMAGERVHSANIATIGYGGMLDRDMGFRFPPYDTESVDEPDEEE